MSHERISKIVNDADDDQKEPSNYSSQALSQVSELTSYYECKRELDVYDNIVKNLYHSTNDIKG